MTDTATSESGSTMRRWDGEGAAFAEVGSLEHVRATPPGKWRPAGIAPFAEEGSPLVWRYGLGAEAMWVVRDDARGLVGWLPSGSQRVAMVPADGSALRGHDLVSRFEVPRALRQSWWQGSGVLRIAPTAKPWSIWYFTEDDGSFGGHYVNLELPHLRSSDEPVSISTRDLILDVWIDAAGTWLKDEDELDAAVASSRRFSAEDAASVRTIAAAAHQELVVDRSWPMNEAWEDWRPPQNWIEPGVLPAELWNGAAGR